MELWHLWTNLLSDTLLALAQQWGLPEAVAIIGLTLIARVGLMPVSLTAAYRGELNKRRIQALKPALAALKAQHAGSPSALQAATLALYRQHGVRLLDRITLLNIGTQGVFGLGLFQALGRAEFSSRFLWIGSLAKPDVWLTVLVAVLMALGMALMPGMGAEPSMWLMVAVSVVVATVAVAAMPSAVGIYWATSNVLTLGQNLALRWLVRRLPVAATPT